MRPDGSSQPVTARLRFSAACRFALRNLSMRSDHPRGSGQKRRRHPELCVFISCWWWQRPGQAASRSAFAALVTWRRPGTTLQPAWRDSQEFKQPAAARDRTKREASPLRERAALAVAGDPGVHRLHGELRAHQHDDHRVPDDVPRRDQRDRRVAGLDRHAREQPGADRRDAGDGRGDRPDGPASSAGTASRPLRAPMSILPVKPPAVPWAASASDGTASTATTTPALVKARALPPGRCGSPTARWPTTSRRRCSAGRARCRCVAERRDRRSLRLRRLPRYGVAERSRVPLRVLCPDH
jgi:hypothetical protein